MSLRKFVKGWKTHSFLKTDTKKVTVHNSKFGKGSVTHSMWSSLSATAIKNMKFDKKLSSVDEYAKAIKDNRSKFNGHDQRLINKCLPYF